MTLEHITWAAVCERMEMAKTDDDAVFVSKREFAKIRAVVEVAQRINEARRQEEIIDYPLDNFFELHRTLWDLGFIGSEATTDVKAE